MASFADFHLPEPIARAIKELGYAAPTRIQEQAIPLILSGKDVIGHSQTGSGKTAAFGLPILSKLGQGQGIRALILTPTRELCLQVSEAIRGFGRHLPIRVVPVFGGVGIGPQMGALRSADIVVATPGRLLDVMERGVRLSAVKIVVLDEADRMLDMGFIDDVERIVSQTPPQRQTLLFSATLSSRLESLVHRFMKAPVRVEAAVKIDASLLKETAYLVKSDDKLSLLVHLLKNETSGLAIVFCATRHGCDKVAKRVRTQGVDATPIHGGLSQNQRNRAIEQIRHRGTGVLIATDVASRGLHIEDISHVYNYDLPKTPDDYIHRIGRTARAGAKGNAVTFVTAAESRDFHHILRDLRRDVEASPLPVFEKIVIPTGPQQGRPYHGAGERRGFDHRPRPGGSRSHAPRGESRSHGGWAGSSSSKQEGGSRPHTFKRSERQDGNPSGAFKREGHGSSGAGSERSAGGQSHSSSHGQQSKSKPFWKRRRR